MSNAIRLALVLHNHQPVGNFEGVFEQSYQDSYLPFLDVFEPYSQLRIGLHTSGPLMEWLDRAHPEYLDRLARLVAAGRIEIIGGAFYEAILAMIPSRDRIGQITSYTDWLEHRLGAVVQGMWMPERVWEQSMTRDLVAAGTRYTLLDDFHFKNAGLTEDELHGYYLTEDDGHVLSVFPGSERLRYVIPFADPQETIDHLGKIAAAQPNAVVVFGDDGEKFGTWPDTKKHVYEDGWLRRFFDLLAQNQSWIRTTTLAEIVENVPPQGKVYLPEGSYREMTEWALPAEQIVQFDHVKHELEHDQRWSQVARFVRGGFWRNFKVKYPEADEMYARMMMVSRRLQAIEESGAHGEWLNHARIALYRGQCNCPYWHGAFGGIYLPHLRNAIYNQLIAADNLLDRAMGQHEPYVELTAEDYNFDARQELRLTNDKLLALLAPSRGGLMYELDVRTICLNLGATLTRRPEAYHRKVLAGANAAQGQVASIHDRVVFKQANLDQRLQYDHYSRQSLLDHFFDDNATLESVAQGQAAERGDFLQTVYDAKLRRSTERVQAQMSRTGRVHGQTLKITKGVTLEAESNALQIAYLLEGLPPQYTFHFAVEFNFAGLPSGADDRYFCGAGRQRLGHLGTKQNLSAIRQLGLVDEWLGIDVGLGVSRPTDFWAFPIETVSQSEGGFELVHQSVCVMPHWYVQGDADGRWSVTLNLSLDTALAETRQEKGAAIAATT
ncbi:MAG TPA: alpha-amylase/4-alpha-glucanotransferase domain-containing protein [Pirellulales bacterium]|jgi:alpha-amylase|nr:alpha-amylase/4-alpha-glucanotransferase domain-containing protein [Pirellulales bacterium]